MSDEQKPKQRARRGESSGSTQKTEAENFLKKQMETMGNGNFLSTQAKKITVGELFEAVVTDYRNNEKSIKLVERVWKYHLGPFFGHMRTAKVGTDQIARYISARKSEKKPAANATINRELGFLRRAFSLGCKSKTRNVTSVLDLSEHMLEENNVRTGFVDEAQYKTLAEKAAGYLWLRAMLALGYTYGFRKSELLNLLPASRGN